MNQATNLSVHLDMGVPRKRVLTDKRLAASVAQSIRHRAGAEDRDGDGEEEGPRPSAA